MLKKKRYLAFCLTFSLALAHSMLRAEAPQWGYYDDIGPDQWGNISEEFATCKTGKAQSPINIGRQVTSRLPPLQFRYRSIPMTLINNGHSIEIAVPPGSQLKIAGTDYELKQLHFHTPSEHKRGGYQLPMEIHFVHKSRDGELAFVAAARAHHIPPKLHSEADLGIHSAGGR